MFDDRARPKQHFRRAGGVREYYHKVPHELTAWSASGFRESAVPGELGDPIIPELDFQHAESAFDEWIENGNLIG